MRKTIKRFVAVASLALLTAQAWAAAPADLIGTWKANPTEVSLGGSFEFRSNGTFSIKPDTMAEGVGKYDFDGQILTMRLDSSPQFPVEGAVQFTNQNTKMFIQFTKGPAQEFVKVTAQPKKTK